MICVLAGGVGAARLLAGLVQVLDPAEITAVVNTGDDCEITGLAICPDLDTITYTLGGVVNPDTGWGRAGETFTVLEGLARFGVPDWFALGDQDLSTHLYRTSRLRGGATLTEVTAEVAAAFGIGVRLLPMSDDPVRTKVTLVGGEVVDFQEYFVRRRHAVAVEAVAFAGAEDATVPEGVLGALEEADSIVIAPSNPIVSIGPLLALKPIAELLERRRHDVVAVSPIVGGRALKGPADRLLVELGGESSALGVAERLAPVLGTLVIDDLDAALAPAIEALGLGVVVAETVMTTPARAASLAASVLAAGGAHARG